MLNQSCRISFPNKKSSIFIIVHQNTPICLTWTLNDLPLWFIQYFTYLNLKHFVRLLNAWQRILDVINIDKLYVKYFAIFKFRNLKFISLQRSINFQKFIMRNERIFELKWIAMLTEFLFFRSILLSNRVFFLSFCLLVDKRYFPSASTVHLT